MSGFPLNGQSGKWTGCAAFALCMLMVSLVTNADAPYLYRLRDVGTLGGPSSKAAAINNRGWVVGHSETASGNMKAFVWSPEEGMREIKSSGDSACLAHAINDHGTVVGEVTGEEGGTKAFVWTADHGMRELKTGKDVFYSVAFALNNHQQIVGTTEDGEGHHAVVWMGEDLRVLPRLPGGGYVQPLDVNDHGDVVGQIQTRGGSIDTAASHAYYFRRALTADNLTEFKLLSHFSGSAAVTLNNQGMAAGYVIPDSDGIQASRFSRAENFVMLDDGGALYSSVTDINNHDQMCGSYIAAFASDESACVWHQGRMLNLNEITEKNDDWHLVQATGINDQGQITGYGLWGDDEQAFILDPLPDADPLDWPVLMLTVSDRTESQDTERIVVLSGEPGSGAAVREIRFYTDGELQGSVQAPPYEWGWQGPLDVPHVFHATLIDERGRRASSRFIRLDSAAP